MTLTLDDRAAARARILEDLHRQPDVLEAIERAKDAEAALVLYDEVEKPVVRYSLSPDSENVRL